MLAVPGATDKEVQAAFDSSFVSFQLSQSHQKVAQGFCQNFKDDEVVSREISDLALRNTCLKWGKQSGHPGSPIPALSLP